MAQTDPINADPELKEMWRSVCEIVKVESERLQKLSDDDRSGAIFRGLFAPILQGPRRDWKIVVGELFHYLSTVSTALGAVVILILKNEQSPYLQWFIIPATVVALMLINFSISWGQSIEKRWRSRMDFLLWKLAEAKYSRQNNSVGE
ncbi:MAG TPA: hypothetical protein VGN88_12185 [Phycisphaerae bacterium]|jgi:hypothetical protein